MTTLVDQHILRQAALGENAASEHEWMIESVEAFAATNQAGDRLSTDSSQVRAPGTNGSDLLSTSLLKPLRLGRTYWVVSCYAFTVCVLSLWAAGLVLDENATNHGMLSAIVAVIGTLLVVGHNVQKTLFSAIHMRFEQVLGLAEHLKQEKEKAEGANRDKTRFLASASHDLRQPLHALSLFADALGAELSSHKAKGLLDNIGRSIEALNQLLSSLLDISKLDAHIVEANKRHFRLGSLIDLLHTEYGPQAMAKGLVLRTRVEHAAVIHSDPVLLETVLRNLISNAIRYTNSGSIEICCTPAATQVRIAIRDTGIGISADKHAEVFREFYQLANPERDRQKGLGLGLAIVDRVVRLLDHTIELESELGRGSCFTVVVPQGIETAVEETDSLPSYVDGEDLRGMRIVVIDDEIAVRNGMQAVLTRWGIEPILAGSEDEAMEKIRADAPPHLIVADYRLRDGKTGAEAIENLRRRFGGDVPAMIVTGDTDPARLREAQASGHMLMHKPLQPAKLRAYLRRIRRSMATTL